MKLGYTILYVRDAEASLVFFEKAFGLPRRFYHESGYGEIDTGSTALGFASHELGASNLPHGYVRADESPLPLGMEIALVTDDVSGAYKQALDAGAVALAGIAVLVASGLYLMHRERVARLKAKAADA